MSLVAVFVILILHRLVGPVGEMERANVIVPRGHGVGDVHQLVAVVLQAQSVGGRRGADVVDDVRAAAVNPRGVGLRPIFLTLGRTCKHALLSLNRKIAHAVILRHLVVLRVVGAQR